MKQAHVLQKSALSPREQLVLKMAAKGYTHEQIANQLSISTETVKKHVRNSYKKLGAHNKIQALRKAGLI